MTIHSQQAPPAAARPARKLALTALIIGIIALLTAAVPVLGAVLGVTAVIFGAVGLKKRQPKGLSLTGLILGVLATITSIAVTITLIAMAGNLFNALEEASSDSEGVHVQEAWDDDGEDLIAGDATAADGRIPWNAFDTADAPLSPHAGTEEDPHPIGSRFTVDDQWEIVVNMVDPDALEQILALAPENVPPAEGERYVLMNLTMNNLTAEPGRAGSLNIYYGVPGKLHSSRDRNNKIMTPEPAIGQDMQITGNYTGYVALRTKDVAGETLRVSGFSSRDTIFVALE